MSRYGKIIKMKLLLSVLSWFKHSPGQDEIDLPGALEPA
jgi:hypothetical protein